MNPKKEIGKHRCGVHIPLVDIPLVSIAMTPHPLIKRVYRSANILGSYIDHRFNVATQLSIFNNYNLSIHWNSQPIIISIFYSCQNRPIFVHKPSIHPSTIAHLRMRFNVLLCQLAVCLFVNAAVFRRCIIHLIPNLWLECCITIVEWNYQSAFSPFPHQEC